MPARVKAGAPRHYRRSADIPVGSGLPQDQAGRPAFPVTQSRQECRRSGLARLADGGSAKVRPVKPFNQPRPMPEFHIPYGRTQLTARVPAPFQAELLAPAAVPPAKDPSVAVRAALKSPVGGVRLRDFAGARSVAIAINDKTRPVPHALLLPPLLEELAGLGIPDQAVTFIIATGLHAPMAAEEFAQVLPPGDSGPVSRRQP